MAARSYSRGHPVVFKNNQWVWEDDETPIEGNERVCARCGQAPTPEGFDACLGHIDGAENACCGHGVQEGYVVMSNARLDRTGTAGEEDGHGE